MAPEPAPQSDELIEMLRAVRDRVRAQNPGTSAAGIPLPDLMPVVHARDAALAKVASIGTVNPRPPGLLNSAVQSVKRLIARALDWHVREQVEFNREVIASLNAVIEALSANNRLLAGSADMSALWLQWRTGWEQKLAQVEIEFLRNAAETHAVFEKRVTALEEGIRGQVTLQHRDFSLALNRAVRELRRSFEQMVHSELRILRQHISAAEQAMPAPAAPPEPELPAATDDFAHQERFRGSEDDVRERQRSYVPFFSDCANVVDLGCGRGEFLEVMREAGINARGVDLSPEAVAICRAKGLSAEAADLFAFLAAMPDGSLGGVFSAQVVEHLPPERLPEMIRLAAARLAPGGRLAIETPNPECLAIFASHFYLDPTHARPVPARLLAFYLQEAGMGEVTVEPRSPAIETMPALGDLPPAFRDAFFGGLDYAIFARKL